MNAPYCPDIKVLASVVLPVLLPLLQDMPVTVVVVVAGRVVHR